MVVFNLFSVLGFFINIGCITCIIFCINFIIKTLKTPNNLYKTIMSICISVFYISVFVLILFYNFGLVTFII